MTEPAGRPRQRARFRRERRIVVVSLLIAGLFLVGTALWISHVGGGPSFDDANSSERRPADQGGRASWL